MPAQYPRHLSQQAVLGAKDDSLDTPLHLASCDLRTQPDVGCLSEFSKLSQRQDLMKRAVGQSGRYMGQVAQTRIAQLLLSKRPQVRESHGNRSNHAELLIDGDPHSHYVRLG